MTEKITFVTPSIIKFYIILGPPAQQLAVAHLGEVGRKYIVVQRRAADHVQPSAKHAGGVPPAHAPRRLGTIVGALVSQMCWSGSGDAS